MATHASLAAHLLRDAALFYLAIARDNADIHDDMVENAAVYERVACLIEADPTGEVANSAAVLSLTG